MGTELTFRTIFGSMLLVLVAVRLYYHRKAQTFREPFSTPYEGATLGLLRAVLAPVWFGSLLAYIFAPWLVDWATTPLPIWMRWFGVLLGLGGILGVAWVNHALGVNFSTTLRVRSDHTLVTNGPYRWIRHPMYTVFVVLMLALFLISANWLLGGVGMLTLAIVMVIRTPREEQMLQEKFGDTYTAYMQRTGRFLPKL